LKVDGQRAYARARRGESLVMEARPVTIHSVRCTQFAPPAIRLDITCGTGTYVRSLGRDIARAVGTEAVMAELRRVAIGPFHIEQAVALNSLEQEGLAGLSNRLLPPGLALLGLQTRQLTEQEERRVRQGQTIDGKPVQSPATPSFAELGDVPPPSDATTLAAYDASGQLVSLLRQVELDRWRPALVFPPEPTRPFPPA
jgi:tRNA pseudouridine55 synthase